MTHSLTRRTTATVLLSFVLVSAGASTASARPDPIDVQPVAGGVPAVSCALQRIDRQLVRCDNLTGAGIAAPLFIPELLPLGQPAVR